MNNGTRSLVVIALLLLAAHGANAQKLLFVFAHGQYASPVQSSFKNDYNFGLGAEAGVGIGPGKTKLVGTVGYTVFDAKSKELGNITYVPVKVGFRRYFLPGNLLFLHADAGIGHIKDKTTNSSYSRFTADVGAGAKLGPLEVGIAYDGFKRVGADGYASWLAFKAGWRFGL
ncbi:outer membrane beta-barrel protein [Longitalea arenae]|uniref:outer membrane beta-barrel protein n=1 Tax=Longitalea arenae TaxID=2812558 RepID=UPI0019670C68|nr:outer membrane beta-barrel protein [Longitalea arenae]